MAEIPKELKPLLFGKGPKWHARSAMALDWLGLVFLVVGIVADGINMTLGLETTHWFIMAIAMWVWGLWSWFCAYFASKEG